MPPAARISSMEGMIFFRRRVSLKTSLQAIRTFLSGCDGCLAAVLKATGTTVLNLKISAMSYTKESGFPLWINPIAGAYPAARTAASVIPYRQEVAALRHLLTRSPESQFFGS